MWLWFAAGAGVLHGFYDIFRKKTLQDIPLLQVLALYSFFCFLLVSFELKNALQIPRSAIILLILKSIIIFVSWILGFWAMRSLPISIATPLDTLTPVFTIFLGLLILNERLGVWQAVGVLIILTAYYLIGKAGNSEIGSLLKNKFFYMAVGSAILSAISALIDKYALKVINSGQLQFWFCFFLMLLYWGAYLWRRIKTGDQRSFQFKWSILFMSLFLVTADRLYFHAVSIPSSQLSLILPIRRISVLESSIGGGIIFREKNLKVKFWCICLALVGIVLIFLKK